MKIEPKEEQTDLFQDLTPVEKITRKIAIVVAFLGVFVWAAKILLA